MRFAAFLMIAGALTASGAVATEQVMLVGTGPGSGDVHMFDFSNGDYLGLLLSVGGNVASGIAVGVDGDIYVGSFFTDCVVHWDRDTGAVSSLDLSAHVSGPTGLEVDASGNLYVASSATGQIMKYDADGNYLSVFASGIPNVSGISFCENGNLYVNQVGTPGDASDCAVRKYNSTGGLVRIFDTGAELNDPLGLVTYTDAAPYCYVASSATDDVVRYIRSLGTYDASWQLRTADGSAPFVGLSLPTDVECDPSGDVYVAVLAGLAGCAGLMRRRIDR